MRVTVLGASGTYPSAGGACNSYLVEGDSAAVLLDIGPGSMSNFFKVPGHDRVKCLVITHMHPDHLTDIFPYRYYLQFTADSGILPITVLAPPGAREKIQSFSADSNTEGFDRVFRFVDLEHQGTYRFGDLTLEALEVAHMAPTYSVRVSDDTGVVYYSSDTGWDDRLAGYAADADLFICEATLRETDVDGKVAHLSGGQAGQVAERALVKKLVLGHLWAHFDKREILADARSAFSGPVELAVEGTIYEIGCK